ncbi:hypothetical protein [Bacillus altitudinis]|uniref:hypothetical protein n=1 Tax=Bacillus altitudinis TaxID=293387 RepID=UPI0021015608|nr:hypothetical protein [Bacillus altitudinis]UTV32019.1 hypothetical protein NM966_14720 [Bacillus altitudinis]
MAKYKTEKRKANVGERILITNVDVNETRYENGAVLDVIDSQGRVVHDKKGRLIYDHEYEVIVGEHKPAPNLYEMDYDELITLSEAVMKALRTRSYKNGYDQGRFDAEIEVAHGTYEKSDQQKRDEIVEKAKEDVRQLLDSDYGHDHEFVVNIAKRTVVDLRKIKGCTNIARRGIAKCAPDDCFNAHIGKAIALRRAIRLEVPTEYLNAPQPTEVRVGDVVRGIYAGGNETYEETLRKIEGGRYTYDSGGFDYIEETDLVIIDDSRAGVSE